MLPHFLRTGPLYLLLVLLAVPVTAQNLVHDQSYEDPTFVEFKLQLVDAILKKDTTLLFSLAADNVRVDDDKACAEGNQCFKAIFRRLPAATNTAWNDLYAAVSHGFAHIKLKQPSHFWSAGTGAVIFQAPSYKALVDENQYTVVLGEYVNVREKPTIYSKSIGKLNFEKVRCTTPKAGGELILDDDGHRWYQVKLYNGRKGYVREDLTSYAVLRELSVRKVNGQWKIISFYMPGELPGC